MNDKSFDILTLAMRHHEYGLHVASEELLLICPDEDERVKIIAAIEERGLIRAHGHPFRFRATKLGEAFVALRPLYDLHKRLLNLHEEYRWRVLPGDILNVLWDSDYSIGSMTVAELEAVTRLIEGEESESR